MVVALRMASNAIIIIIIIITRLVMRHNMSIALKQWIAGKRTAARLLIRRFVRYLGRSQLTPVWNDVKFDPSSGAWQQSSSDQQNYQHYVWEYRGEVDDLRTQITCSDRIRMINGRFVNSLRDASFICCFIAESNSLELATYYCWLPKRQPSTKWTRVPPLEVKSLSMRICLKISASRQSWRSWTPT